jgi:glucose-6-phosphate dehydrogenase assembly protein OpcA
VTGLPAPHARARVATLVVVGPPERLMEAARVIDELDEAGSLRCILIPTEPGATLDLEPSEHRATVQGVPPAYLNNAIAALRLSSLPTVVWWRGGPPDRLEGAASLADRVVLDAEHTDPLWARATALFSRTALTDMRWARLTRWRAILAHLFDLPQVQRVAASFDRLWIAGTDPARCALLGGWLDASLGWDGGVSIEQGHTDSTAGLAAVRLQGPAGEIELRLLTNGVCIASEARAGATLLASRVVSAGGRSLPALLSQELRLRSRDVAFEQALSRVATLAPRGSG